MLAGADMHGLGGYRIVLVRIVEHAAESVGVVRLVSDTGTVSVVKGVGMLSANREGHFLVLMAHFDAVLWNVHVAGLTAHELGGAFAVHRMIVVGCGFVSTVCDFRLVVRVLLVAAELATGLLDLGAFVVHFDGAPRGHMVATGLIAVELLAEVQGVLRMSVRLFAGTGADGALHVVQSFGLHGAGHSGQIVARNDSHWGASLIMRAGGTFQKAGLRVSLQGWCDVRFAFLVHVDEHFCGTRVGIVQTKLILVVVAGFDLRLREILWVDVVHLRVLAFERGTVDLLVRSGVQGVVHLTVLTPLQLCGTTAETGLVQRQVLADRLELVSTTHTQRVFRGFTVMVDDSEAGVAGGRDGELFAVLGAGNMHTFVNIMVLERTEITSARADVHHLIAAGHLGEIVLVVLAHVAATVNVLMPADSQTPFSPLSDGVSRLCRIVGHVLSFLDLIPPRTGGFSNIRFQSTILKVYKRRKKVIYRFFLRFDFLGKWSETWTNTVSANTPTSLVRILKPFHSNRPHVSPNIQKPTIRPKRDRMDSRMSSLPSAGTSNDM